MSPDDLPIVGEVPNVDGLFLNTGHGSLGWTIGLATGEMLAQAVVHKLIRTADAAESDDKQQKEPMMYELSDGSVIDPKFFSPGRFS